MSVEKEYFAEAAAEVAGGFVDEDLYIKSLALAGGDERRARAAYISLRAEEIKKQRRKEKIVGAASIAAGVAIAAGSAAADVVKGPAAQQMGSSIVGFIKTALRWVFFIILAMMSVVFGKIIRDVIHDGGSRVVSRDIPRPVVANSNNETGEIGVLIKSIAKDLNQDLPVMVDEVTRLDSVSFVPSSQMVYHYTLTNITGRKVDSSAAAEFIRDLRKKVCAEEEMIELFQVGITAVYSYSSNDGYEVFRAPINSSHCDFLRSNKASGRQSELGADVGAMRAIKEEAHKGNGTSSANRSPENDAALESIPQIGQAQRANPSLNEPSAAFIEYERQREEVLRRSAERAHAVGKRWDYRTGRNVWIDAEGNPISQDGSSSE